MGLADRIAGLGRSGNAAALGLALSAVWLVLVLLFWLLVPGGSEGASGIGRLLVFVGVAMPLALIWMAVALAGAIAALRAEADDLRLRLSQMRDGGTAPRPAMGGGIAPPPATSTLPADPPRPRAGAQPNVRPRAADARPVDARQASMPLDDPEPVSVPPSVLVRALNFPDGPEDTETVAALRAALQDHDNARVLRAAQDVITLLAGQDLYMDDLPPEPAPVAVWRRFAEGARGATVAQLGGIHEPVALEIATELLRGDEIFRDSAHHFLRHFDVMLTRSISQLDDDQIRFLSQTRSARAFMLLGRAAGIFG
ncbi:hypothetical protein [Paracoccus siganidrum]|uniref:Uncharacterized protein n=1 Tax=Paracoccus siganidrum TaxID=1276757 RepID=A0A419A9B0_9RHOB|nr:hypothetical protein [Paracoccus siganidrum]RJL18815.1 hypothetical protein D3P05_06290 [Paracoccus siganidrum]RMC38866.1 hypothetical protein C9E82_05870 [Paracoccus siganidrum]